MNISKNFTFEELVSTNTGLLNIPNDEQIENLTALVDNVLQPLRDLYGHPIKVNSGFRSAMVNKRVKGSSTSQHLKGEAADLNCANNRLLFYLIKDNLEFDELIWEAGTKLNPSWIHVSFTKKNRKKVLRMINGNYFPL